MHKDSKEAQQTEENPAVEPEGSVSATGSTPDGSTPDGSTPDGSTPDGSTPDGDPATAGATEENPAVTLEDAPADGPAGAEAGERVGADEPVADEEQTTPGGLGVEASAEAEQPEPVDELEELRASAQQTHDRLLRTAADFENFRRRARRDSASAVAQAEEKVAGRFLPIIDNLERAIAHAEQNGATDEAKNLLDGISMVHKQFLTALGECQIAPFNSVGETFDPELHEAIQQVASDEPRNTVTLEVQKGYRRGDRLVRPAMVVVSSGPAVVDEPAEGVAAESLAEGDESLAEGDAPTADGEDAAGTDADPRD